MKWWLEFPKWKAQLTHWMIAILIDSWYWHRIFVLNSFVAWKRQFYVGCEFDGCKSGDLLQKWELISPSLFFRGMSQDANFWVPQFRLQYDFNATSLRNIYFLQAMNLIVIGNLVAFLSFFVISFQGRWFGELPLN